MKVVCISDLHGYLPRIPECDLLLIAGDVCPVHDHTIAFQRQWIETNFNRWLYEIPAREIAMVAGNHDWVFAQDKKPAVACRYMEDSSVYFGGLHIFGSPWQREFCDWAFNLSEEDLDMKYQGLPACDILVTHGPVFGHGDRCPNGEHVGSKSLLAWVDRVQPKLVVSGHIHHSYGTYRRGQTTIVNASLRDEQYKVANKPMEIEL